MLSRESVICGKFSKSLANSNTSPMGRSTMTVMRMSIARRAAPSRLSQRRIAGVAMVATTAAARVFQPRVRMAFNRAISMPNQLLLRSSNEHEGSRNYSFSSSNSDEVLKSLKRHLQTSAAKSEPEECFVVTEDGARQHEHTLALGELLRHLIRVAVSKSRKAHAPGGRGSPFEFVLVGGDEFSCEAKVVRHDGPRPRQHTLARAERDERQDFRWRTATNRRVVLEARDTVEQRAVARRQPADAESGESERLRHDAETHRALGDVGGGGQPVTGRILQSAIHLVR